MQHPDVPVNEHVGSGSNNKRPRTSVSTFSKQLPPTHLQSSWVPFDWYLRELPHKLPHQTSVQPVHAAPQPVAIQAPALPFFQYQHQQELQQQLQQQAQQPQQQPIPPIITDPWLSKI